MVANPNLPALPNVNAIKTADGKIIDLPAGGLASFLTAGSGNSYSPIWRVKQGQPLDDFKPARASEAEKGKFYLTRNRKDRETQGKWTECIGPFDAPLVVYPLGYHLERSSGKYHTDTKTYEEKCHSANFMIPDARYAGQTLQSRDGVLVTTVQCATQGPNGLVEVCPLAKGTTVGGKWIPPECAAVYIVGVALNVDHDIMDEYGKPIYDEVDGVKTKRHISGYVLAEVYHRVTSAKFGKKIVVNLAAMGNNGIPAYQYPMEMTIAEGKGAGFNLESKHLTDKATLPDDQDTADHMREELDKLVTQWKESVIPFKLGKLDYIPQDERNAAAEPAGAVAVNPKSQDEAIEGEILI